MNNSANLFSKAIEAFRKQDLPGAERVLKRLLREQPGYFDALSLLVIVLIMLDRHQDAERYANIASKINSKDETLLSNYGLILKSLGEHEGAIEKFSEALKINDKNYLTWHNRGTVFHEMRRYEDAVADFDRAASIEPRFDETLISKGNSLSHLAKFEEAIGCYDSVLARQPDSAEALLGRGNALYRLAHYEEAIVAYDRALALNPELAEAWLGRGNSLFDLKRSEEALISLDRALAIKSELAEIWLGRGNALYDLKRYEEAFSAYEKALTRKPDLESAYLGLGNVYYDLKRYDEAMAAYDKALEFKPDLVEAWIGRGNLFSELKRHEENIAAYDKALALKPDIEGAEGWRLFTKMVICDWSNFEADRSHLLNSIKDGKPNEIPFGLLSISESPDLQLQYARLWASIKYPAAKNNLWKGEVYKHDKIRIAYLSPDLREHPVSFLLAGVFEQHDRSRFETTAISIGPDDKSEMRRRLENAFDKFIDVRVKSDGDIARLLRSSEIDIVIDLGGYTRDSRSAILANRPAPIQINYLGYAGTMGAAYIDYLIADSTLVPPSYRSHYSEKIVTLPNSFMPNDESKRVVSERAFNRSEFGLPENGFVFCCFNQAFKFNPDIFKTLMAIMQSVDNSVLWLSEFSPAVISNLRNEARAAGIDPDRLVFASRMPSYAEHLARHKLADLFLDTLPYNAHTSASDALWSGLPVLTQIGETFAGRVAASLLNTVGLPELIAKTKDEYKRKAIELASSPAKLAAIKTELEHNRRTAPLFQTKLYTRHLESAYEAMYRRQQDGLPPEHITVAP
jgi:predicted O-linked N-acetylglucosamine transferase (SPINDLY family)